MAAKLQRGRSSVGRAPALQAGGQEFESLRLHRRCNKTVTIDIVHLKLHTNDLMNKYSILKNI